VALLLLLLLLSMALDAGVLRSMLFDGRACQARSDSLSQGCSGIRRAWGERGDQREQKAQGRGRKGPVRKKPLV
jgi:hypothetical protein